jgi:hypothetical protein
LGIIEEIANTVGKIVKEEESNIIQTTLTLFSAFANPQNLRILAPSSEGKTYLVTKVSELFPVDYVIPLAHVTPKAIKYCLNAGKIVENGDDNWQDLEIATQPIEEELGKTKDKEKQEELKRQLQELRETACDKIDFENKILIFLDSQSFAAFEDLKPVLSHDQKYLKSFSVNKSKSGSLEGKKTLSIGFPAVIYCSAKDEQKKDETNEINTRFNTISLNSSKKKYRKMLELEAVHSSLPDFIFQEEIVDDEEIEHLKQRIVDCIEELKTNDVILNPFAIGISALFPDDAGSRTRQLKILNNNTTMLTLLNRNNRPRLVVDSEKIPIVTRKDIEDACNLTKEPREIQPYKIKIFNEQIKPAIKQHGNEIRLVHGDAFGLSVSEIVNHAKFSHTKDRKKIQETILTPLVDQGFLEKIQDRDNKTQDLYYIPKKYLDKDAILESTLIDISTLDYSCLDSFVNKYVKRRFEKGELAIEDEKGNSINPQQLIELLNNRHSTTQNRHELVNVETSTDVDKVGSVV